MHRCSLIMASLVFTTLLTGFALAADNPLEPVKTDSPRDTMKTFMNAMNTYKTSLAKPEGPDYSKLDDAVRTLNLSEVPQVLREEKGRAAAILLKEVIDRVIVINLSLVPDTASIDSPRWRLKGTEITIRRVEDGADREGEWLFSSDTVYRVPQFFAKTEHLAYKEGTGGGAGYKPPWIEQHVPEWAKSKSFGLLHWQWIGLFLVILVGLLGKWVAERILALVKILAGRSRGEWDDKIVIAGERPIGLIAATAFWFAGVKMLGIGGTPLNVLTVMIQVVFSFAVIWLFLKLTDVVTEYLREWTKKTDAPLDDQLVPLLARAVRLFIVVFGVLIAVQNLGVNVMSLLAGLGLGGLAFALAFKDTAANLFGSIMILWDQPFKVGDWIKTSSAEGTVEEIGFRSTRIRTFYDSQVTVPNSSMANANIDNMGRRTYRRIYTTLGLTYDTPPEKLEAFLEGLKNIVKANPHTRKDYYQISFSGFGPSSLDIMLYCFVQVPDWSMELLAKQNIYLEVLRLAQGLGVSFAFPSQSLYVEQMPELGQAYENRHEGFSSDHVKTAAAAFGPNGPESRPSGLGIFRAPIHES